MKTHIRPLTADDEPFLWTALYYALHAPPGADPFPPDVVRQPELARYVAGWMEKPGDLGFVAEADRIPVGAAWMRRWCLGQQGYGFVSETVPELSMSLLPGYRGRGIGTALLHRLLSEAERASEAVSLSVSISNPALRLYKRFGFEAVGEPESGSVTMVKRFSPAPLELDHVFVIVEPGAPTEVPLLQEAGITVAPDVSQHTGQGTASRSALFRGVYLELIWVDTTVALAPENEFILERLSATACSGSEGPSPFGLGLRRTAPGADALPFETTPYQAAWMPEGEPPIELIDTSARTGAVFLFIVPPYMSMPSWEPATRSSAPSQLGHGLGLERLTNVRVHTLARPGHAAHLAGIAGLEIAEATHYLLELTFDKGSRGETHDLRPGLPIVIHR